MLDCVVEMFFLGVLHVLDKIFRDVFVSPADGVALGAAASTSQTSVQLIVFVAIMLHKVKTFLIIYSGVYQLINNQLSFDISTVHCRSSGFNPSSHRLLCKLR